MISILLAAYQGEAFLSQQIDSILDQTCQDFRLYIRDDGSTDKTVPILEKYTADNPGKIILMKSGGNSGGAKFNFFSLMMQVQDDYIMLSDQDDVWYPDKIERSLKKIRSMEAVHGKETPLLVHSDLEVVDETLQTIAPSYSKSMKAQYDRTKLRDILIQNTLTGCTALYNRALAQYLRVQPKYMVMHDWWLMLLASAFGKIGTINEPTISYRQHSANAVGAKDMGSPIFQMNRMFHYREIKQAVANTYLQAQCFLELFQDQLTDKQAQLVRDYCEIPQLSKVQRWRTVFRLRTYKHGLIRNIAYLILL